LVSTKVFAGEDQCALRKGSQLVPACEDQQRSRRVGSLGLAETSQQPISQTTWLKVNPKHYNRLFEPLYG